MNIDIKLIEHFYQGELGKLICHLIRKEIGKLWTNTKNDEILGLTYSIPFLEDIEANRLIEMIEAPIENIKSPNNVFIGDTQNLAFLDNSFDKILAIHCLENSNDIHKTIRELWRVLKPEGSMIIIVPNRRGFWSRVDNNPFGFGVPFTRKQIKRKLSDNLFIVKNIQRFLYFPPINIRSLFMFSNFIEKLGANLWPTLGGILIIEVSKRLYAEPLNKSIMGAKVAKLATAHNFSKPAQKINNK